MERVETVLIGGTVWSAGAVLAGREVLVVERGAVIGGEFFDSYRGCPRGEAATGSEAVSKAWREDVAARKALADFYAPAPLLYERLKPLAGRFRMWTEVVSMTPVDDGWELEVFDAEGSDTIRCARVVDSSPECRSHPAFGRGNVLSREYSVAVLAPDRTAEAMLRGGVGEWAVQPGRTADEVLLRWSMPADIPAHAARRRLLEAWSARPEAWKPARILSIAKRAACRVGTDRAELGANYRYRNGAAFDDIYAALDAGAALE